ncbi:MAG: glycosyltransferase [Bacteroidaceae bacterium]|nr:glycosyltransferase [Bacteroidaceae bacterium]
MKRILWLTSIRFSTDGLKGTGTWLQPLATSITQNYEVYHICCGRVKSIEYEEVDGVFQYVIPKRKTQCNTQIPDRKTCDEVKTIIEQVKPDLIHVWGTESRWAYMKVLGLFGSYITILDMQGLLSTCYESYYAGLTAFERMRCIGIKELLQPSSYIYFARKTIKKKAKIESEILHAYENICYQSEWIHNRLKGLCLSANFFATKIIVRPEFWDRKWESPNNSSPVLFSSTAVAHPYKGLHVLIKACSILKQKYPNFILYIAGGVMRKKYGIMSGYESYLATLIKADNMSNNIVFLGNLSAVEMINYQLKSDVCVVPSAVESYCLGLAESLTLGLPTVASYSAAMPTIAKDKDEVLFYSPSDYVDCAEKIIELFENKNLSESLSANSRLRRISENHKRIVVKTQVEIYKSILE